MSPLHHAADLRGAISIGLQEALRGLEEALADLTDAQFRAYPMAGEESIALIALRTLQDLDEHAVITQGGRPTFAHVADWAPGLLSEAADHRDDGALPSRDQVLDWLAAVRASAERLLVAASEEDLHGERSAEGSWPGSAASAYLASIYHAIDQVHRIWLLRGLLRATGKSRLEVLREATTPSTESAQAVAELHYGAVASGNLFVWRATLIRELRSPRRVAGVAPWTWWEAGRRAAEAGASYRFHREAEGDDSSRRLLFARTGGASGADGAEDTVSIHLALTDEGWRVNAAEY
ncbi:MAG: hypothetical protein GX649_02215 [Chloroflexi bacterium]|nr:hypothetical protein [Chloroflexota bacterium]